MADLLLYAAIKARNEYVDKKLAGAGALDFTKDLGPGDSGYEGLGGGGIGSLWKTQLDNFVGSSQNYACIWNTQGYFRCGTSCTFCVPTGVTSLTMEMWGPGGSTSSNCCCGGAPFGPNGAFMALKFDVTPGECLCICAGCAYCCYATQTTPGLVGSPTWFKTDSNLGLTLGCLTACAESAISCYEFWNIDSDIAGLSKGSHTRMIPPGLNSGDSCGPNSCNGWNYCWDNGDDDVEMPPIFSSYWKSSVVCDVSAENRNLEIFKVPGLWPCMYIAPGTNNSSFTSNAPVPRYESCICGIIGCGSTCVGCQYGYVGLGGQAYLCGVPGAGGAGGFVYGGCGACGGDSGRLGFVRIGYNCN